MTEGWDRFDFRSVRYWSNLPLKSRQQVARIPPRFEHETFDTYTVSNPYGSSETLQAVESWSMTGMLLLVGATGRGKTHLAVAYLNRFLQQGLNIGLFVNAMTLARMLDDEQKNSGQLSDVYSNPYLLGYARHLWPLVVLDDFGHPSSHWRDSGIIEIILERYERGLATIVTTQLPIDEHARRFGDDTASRLTEGTMVRCGGEDYRQRGKSEHGR
jgi:DNA replication protein DnaC